MVIHEGIFFSWGKAENVEALMYRISHGPRRIHAIFFFGLKPAPPPKAAQKVATQSSPSFSSPPDFKSDIPGYFTDCVCGAGGSTSFLQDSCCAFSKVFWPYLQ